jgi:hypothetical protein
MRIERPGVAMDHQHGLAIIGKHITQGGQDGRIRHA